MTSNINYKALVLIVSLVAQCLLLRQPCKLSQMCVVVL